MVNVFLIHSGKDTNEAEKIKNELKEDKNANVLLLEYGGKLWKIDAYKKIIKSQIVVFVVGEDSHNSKNIDWELKQAIRKNKVIYYVLLNKGNKINKSLYNKDRFSNKEICMADEAKDINEIIKRIDKYEAGEYRVLNRDIEEKDYPNLIEQYKLFLKTSEDLVARRQNINNFYITVNAALVTAASTIIAVCDGVLEKTIIILLLSISGVVLDVAWIGILESYGRLNACKLKVISTIESKLPARLYDSEWEVMSDKLSNKKYTTFTNSEKRTPFIFMVFYIIVIILVLAYVFITKTHPDIENVKEAFLLINKII